MAKRSNFDTCTRDLGKHCIAVRSGHKTTWFLLLCRCHLLNPPGNPSPSHLSNHFCSQAINCTTLILVPVHKIQQVFIWMVVYFNSERILLMLSELFISVILEKELHFVCNSRNYPIFYYTNKKHHRMPITTTVSQALRLTILIFS